MKCPVLDFRNEEQVQELVRRMNTNEQERLKQNEKDRFDEKRDSFIQNEPKRDEYFPVENQQQQERPQFNDENGMVSQHPETNFTDGEENERIAE